METAALIKQIKQSILFSRYLVAKMANAEMLRLYFSIGKMVEQEFDKNNWGSKVIEQISVQLQQELPGLRGFSGKNISKMRAFYKAWNSNSLICSSLTSKLEKQTNELSSSVTSKLKISNLLKS
jgi:hypothetical protein